MAVITQLDVNGFSQSKVSEKFPNLFLKDVNSTTPLVVKLLEPGDVPLIAEHNNERKVISNISLSAYNVNKLLRTHDNLVFNLSSNESEEINSIEDYLEAVLWI